MKGKKEALVMLLNIRKWVTDGEKFQINDHFGM